MKGSEEKYDLGLFIRNILKERSLSLGKLSSMTGIDKSTISRIINHKQKANINHLQKISKALDIPLEELLKEDGYNVNNQDIQSEGKFDLNNSYNSIDDILKVSSLVENTELESLIQSQLNKYQLYIETDEGKHDLYKNFNNKINKISRGGVFVEKLKEMYREFCSKDIPLKEFLLIGSGLLYFITPIDIIPDFIFPIGFLDDIIAIKIVIDMLEKNRKNKQYKE
ncbi:DUF1232 domain-containing protein [Clostridium botulinum C]|uniref:DUF1232 domain-containing protein n=3 Tax=Clostridium botulinum TaxID=1491 RepID=A0A9Q4TFG5_CLOBO|nr:MULTISPECIES: DUF1232 domain-containing protein [Clostridium]MBO3441175.1 DUF1232 domain-containing protein [Clostridium haemolyticum]MCD3195090.1 DUF1232 domain-containing protein [Clostridium botulinum C]AYF53884.1 DUF1232 domain-containing protein [Clostridium novyi]EES91976.1 transcriptional regulator [Clostridium botulinum D str. 1873]MCD3200430.1 DUF1232 domain-containing protein [Clostridium botulinum C]